MNFVTRQMTALVYLLASLLSACAGTQNPHGLPCQTDDPQCAMERSRSEPDKEDRVLESRTGNAAEHRTGPASADLVTYLALDNIMQGIRDSPLCREEQTAEIGMSCVS